MKLVEWVKSSIQQKSPSSETPEGFCPNCWGRQEYAGDFYNALHQEEINFGNVDKHLGWIQGYAKKNLEGVRLKGETCSVCQVRYQKLDKE